jgi:GNAT superfamily N-acetyltransferase
MSYKVEGGTLKAEQVDWDVPPWHQTGEGEWSVAARIQEWAPVLEEGGILIGALERDSLIGFTILRPKLTETMAQLVAMFVSKDHRGKGVASALFEEALKLARTGGAESIYVSSVPSGSAVGFYRSQGFALAKDVHEELFLLEPEDIHMIKVLASHPELTPAN